MKATRPLPRWSERKGAPPLVGYVHQDTRDRPLVAAPRVEPNVRIAGRPFRVPEVCKAVFGVRPSARNGGTPRPDTDDLAIDVQRQVHRHVAVRAPIELVDEVIRHDDDRTLAQ